MIVDGAAIAVDRLFRRLLQKTTGMHLRKKKDRSCRRRVLCATPKHGMIKKYRRGKSRRMRSVPGKQPGRNDMSFHMPAYRAPDFTKKQLCDAPDAVWRACERDGVPPDGFHSTSMFPEYFKIDGTWRLARESRMDSHVVRGGDGTLRVVEMRRLKKGDRVAVGRTEDGSEGIYVHTSGFLPAGTDAGPHEEFAFRQGRSRETSYARDYDELVCLLRHEREHGNIVWVLGPAFTFDAGARAAMQAMIEQGYVHGLLAGNALAVHDLEGGYFHTALGQDIYTQQSMPNGHYNHMDIIHLVRRAGSIPAFLRAHDIRDGILYGLVQQQVPFVLTGSIRDDGPLPEVYADVYAGTDAMRGLLKNATTVICLATMLHTIAAGNITPSFRCMPDGTVRPVYLYCVDASEFVVNKLIDRGSLTAKTMVANVQDFISRVAGGLGITVGDTVARERGQADG